MAVAVPAVQTDKPVTEEPFSQPVGEPLVPPAEPDYQPPEAAHADVGAPERTAAEQRAINNEALDACAPELRDDCLQSMGYVRPEETALARAHRENPMEGNILAAVVVIIGFLWMGAMLWARLFAARSAYRYITAPPKSRR
jgi:hypothetical protein